MGSDKIKDLSQEQVRELFDYNSETGVVTRRIDIYSGRAGVKNRPICARAGDLAGHICNDGYYNVKVSQRAYRLHRIIWLWQFGYWPEQDVDHINKVRSDNRLCNLRLVNRSCNVLNSTIRSDNSTGVKGVSLMKGGIYLSTITMYGGKTSYLGRTKDFAEAVAHRLAAEQCLGGAFCDGSSGCLEVLEALLCRS